MRKKRKREEIRGKEKEKEKCVRCFLENFHRVLAQTKIDRKTRGSVLQKYLHEKREREKTARKGEFSVTNQEISDACATTRRQKRNK